MLLFCFVTNGLYSLMIGVFLKTFRQIKEKYVVAFLLHRMDKIGRIGLMSGVLGMFFQFLKELIIGIQYFWDNEILEHLMAVLSIASGLAICLFCLVMLEGFCLRRRLKR